MAGARGEKAPVHFSQACGMDNSGFKQVNVVSAACSVCIRWACYWETCTAPLALLYVLKHVGDRQVSASRVPPGGTEFLRTADFTVPTLLVRRNDSQVVSFLTYNFPGLAWSGTREMLSSSVLC